MTTTDSKCREVVVVGAGPVGLSLALGLARRGHDVLVLEKEAATAEHSRAPAIWPGTLEILAQLGVVDTFLDEGLVVRRLQLWDADRDRPLLKLPLEELAEETDYPHLLVLPQSRTEQLLLAALEREPQAEVQFQSQVTAVTEDDARVRVHYAHSGAATSVDARFVAGCDGAHSTVRAALDASFDGETYAIRAALADVEIDGTTDLPFPRISTRPHLAIGIRMTERVWRLILPFAEQEGVPLEQRVQGTVASLFARDFRPLWQSEFQLHRRVSSRFGHGRIILAGDAAHLNSPVGGQGMNAGIQDAAILADALHQALAQHSPDPLLRFATQRRQAVKEGVNQFTDLLTRALLFRRGRLIRPTLRLASLPLRLPPLRHRFLRRLAMLD